MVEVAVTVDYLLMLINGNGGKHSGASVITTVEYVEDQNIEIRHYCHT